jgi:xylitol oxidase
MELDAKNRVVTVGAGVTYGQLAPYIDSRGFAVHNMASLPHISVVGACATATHGSGNGNGNLSTAVRAIEMVTADGSVITLSREKMGDMFAGAVIGLGALGVITKITLEVEPAFQITQRVYENLSFSQLEHHLDDIFASGYSVSLFTDWQKRRATQAWIKQRIGHDKDAGTADFYGAKPAMRKMHPIADHSPESCTEQMGVPGPWYERLPHFKMNFTPSSGAELQTEYFVPRAKGYEAIAAVEQLRDQITPHLFITEFRTIAADELWMSPAYKRDSMAIHFTWKPEWPEVKKILPQIEEKLAPFEARPHWAKLFTMKPTVLQGQYARLSEYRALVGRYDPKGRFRNEFLDTNVLSS